MKKFYKNFKTKHMTVETMLTCEQKCFTKCNCSSVCGGSTANGATIVATHGKVDMYLIATGASFWDKFDSGEDTAGESLALSGCKKYQVTRRNMLDWR